MAENPQPNGQGNAQQGDALDGNRNHPEVGRPSTGQPSTQPTQPEGGASQSASEFPYQPTQPGITDENYRQDPAWKKAQAGFTRTINQLQGQVSELTKAQESKRLEGMNETEQLQYAADRWRQEAMSQATQFQAYQAEKQRDDDLYDIQQRTGVPVDLIKQHLESVDSNSAHDAWGFAVEQRNQTQGQPLAQPQGPPQQPQTQQFGQPQQPPPIDVGGGQPGSNADALQAKYDKARDGYNMGEMMGVMQEADMAGVELKEW